MLAYRYGAGETNTAIGKRMGLIGMPVRRWRWRHRDLGLEVLRDEFRPGRLSPIRRTWWRR